jgi:7,8-dihydropterin-6-yl-methyl-4-(beta-D-ribofuranosyl)aminobenzene 5'-phosphate synthase
MKAVERLEISVLVDNVTDSLSSNPAFVEPEFAFLRRQGMKWLSGKCLCCAAHGLSCLITAHGSSGDAQTLLFDTGPDEWVFERNVTRLGLDLGAVGALVLSHGHWDHTGAMPRALQMIAQASTMQGRGGKNVPVYMHPEMFAQRAVRMKDGGLLPMELVPSVEMLRGSGGDPVVTRDEQSVLGDAFYVSGEIPRVTAFERGFPGQHRQKPDGSWEKDEVMPDERYVSVHIAGKGQVVFTACSHAGLINVLHAARARFPEVPLYGVMGGFHLAGITEAIIPETVAALAEFDLKLIAAAHCTGWRAVDALAAAFGDAVVPSAVGKRYVL